MPFQRTASSLHRHSRGSGLLLVILLLAVLMLIAVAVIMNATSEVEAVSAKRRYDRNVSCSEAARNLVMSKFKVGGALPTSIIMNSVVDDRLYSTGHYDQVAIASVVAAPSTSTQATLGISDISNRVARRQLGGQLFRVTAVCSRADSVPDGGTMPEQNEVEYLVRFGL